MSSSRRAASAIAVNATPSTLSTLRRGTEARLVTAMIVREDSMTLYGFADSDARDLFTTLLSVSGVGPKIALATLAVHDAPALRQALADGDVHRVDPGAGDRQAQRRTDGARASRQGRRRPAPRSGCPPSTATRCAGRWWKPLSDLALRLKQAEEATDKVLADEPEATHLDGAALGAVDAG